MKTEYSTTVKLEGIEFEVYYNIEPYDEGYMYDSYGAGCPPSGGNIEDMIVTYEGVDVTEMLDALCPDKVEKIEENVVINHYDN